MEPADKDRNLSYIESVSDFIYKSLLPHTHTIRRDIRVPHFPDPVFLKKLAEALAIAFIVAPWKLIWESVWKKIMQTNEPIPKTVEQIRQDLESLAQKGEKMSKGDILEALKSSLRAHSTLGADTIDMIAEDMAHYIVKVQSEQEP